MSSNHSPPKPKGKKQEKLSDNLTPEQRSEFLLLFARFVAPNKVNEDNEIDPKDIPDIQRLLIDKSMLERVCKQLGYGHNAKSPIRQEDVQFMMDEVDEDRQGTIDYGEFLELMAKHLNENELADDVIKAFTSLTESKTTAQDDKNQLNTLTYKELKYFMTTYGEKLTDEEADELLNEADIGPQIVINIEEFVRATIMGK
jgi:Ca2+-binding EF-hand superfamily protein